jgi:hypothetical protein
VDDPAIGTGRCELIMKKQAPKFSQRYLAALRLNLDARWPTGTVAARSLGREVITVGFAIINLARIPTIELAAGHGTTDHAEIPFRKGSAA